MRISITTLVEEFREITGLVPSFSDRYLTALEPLVEFLNRAPLRPAVERRREFLARVKSKFRLNAEPLAAFYSAAVAQGFTFHFHFKQRLQRSFDLGDETLFRAVLSDRGVPPKTTVWLGDFFTPISDSIAIAHLQGECLAPNKLRREQGDRDICGEIAMAQFSAFMWVSLAERDMHHYFDPRFEEGTYREHFWDELHARAPQLFNRENALFVALVPQPFQREFYDHLRDRVCNWVARSFESLNNHGFMALAIDPMKTVDGHSEWELACDVSLFAEKHRQSTLDKAYFRWKRVEAETRSHIPIIEPAVARFDLVNEGFTYRDCFVITGKGQVAQRLVLLFQKNERDETPVPCPACRSDQVQGNSYSSLGVRSWECENPLCPDRSKYNRGKRYSFKGLAMQQAIDDEKNEIPVNSVRQWSRDVVDGVDEPDLVDMLVRHYSMHSDVVRVFGWPSFDAGSLGRSIRHLPFPSAEIRSEFWTGPYFARYVADQEVVSAPPENLGDSSFQVLLGDSTQVLQGLPCAIFDGAVTSPPYYNARDYARWPNIYCHMHDMYMIAKQVLRTLKPGAPYLYNVFDYFDNENTVVFSAMGNKRVLLAALTVDAFRRAGFELAGNIVWDKGEIEGKRGFNAGNFSPYYQAPFNCWEHILVFRKPGGDPDVRAVADRLAGRVLRQGAVIKMIRGENVHGHTAPFPDEIPALLMQELHQEAVVLDPFGGSLTTGRVAERHGLRSVCIERNREYCELGLRIRSASIDASRNLNRSVQISLF